jgi:ribosome-binding protein aMBF1 (putative translation factor)
MDNIMTTNDTKARKTLVRLKTGGLSLNTALPEPTQGSQSSLTPVVGLSNMTTAEQLGMLIQQHRQDKDISQVDLADLASISVGTLKNAEQGRNIGVDQMFAILRALGVNIYA